MSAVRSLILLVLLGPFEAAAAQDYPTRPITMIVPFSAGGPGDVIARILGSAMNATLKQSIVIENVLGDALHPVRYDQRLCDHQQATRGDTARRANIRRSWCPGI